MVKTNTVLRSSYQILENRVAVATEKVEQAKRELAVDATALAEMQAEIVNFVPIEDLPVGYLLSFEGRQFILSFAGFLTENGKCNDKRYTNLFDAQLDIFMGRVGNG